MHVLPFVILIALAAAAAVAAEPTTAPATGKLAPKPLFRDPVYDGAADPVLVYNRGERKWFMFYTNRRANVPNLPGVSWLHATRLGIAESADGGATWTYRGVATIDHGTPEDAHWAPDIVYHAGTYHMFLTFVPGVHTDWSGTRDLLHLTSRDLLKWHHESTLKLASNRVIDASLIQLPDQTWRMFYNDETDHKAIRYADSPDLFAWTDKGKAAVEQAGEGPKAFHWRDRYWLIVDHWQGLGVYRSDDCLHWTRQPHNLLEQPGTGADDGQIARHADVVVSGGRAFLFYFTHPQWGPKDGKQNTADQRRSSIQVAELHLAGGEITCDRDRPTYVDLKPPADAD